MLGKWVLSTTKQTFQMHGIYEIFHYEYKYIQGLHVSIRHVVSCLVTVTWWLTQKRHIRLGGLKQFTKE